MIADGTKVRVVNYFPNVNGKTGRVVRVSTGHPNLYFVDLDDGTPNVVGRKQNQHWLFKPEELEVVE